MLCYGLRDIRCGRAAAMIVDRMSNGDDGRGSAETQKTLNIFCRIFRTLLQINVDVF